VLDRAEIRPDDTIVDVRAGRGLLVLGALGRLGPDGAVLAIDSSADRLEQLRTTCDDPRVSYLVGGPDVLPLTDASADVVLADSVLVDVPNETEAARELFRVLRSGGRLSIFTEAGFSGLDSESAAPAGRFLAGGKP
jgi:arsenite methyltransferase